MILILRLVNTGIKPIFNDIKVTVMNHGGVSSDNEFNTFNDFKLVTIKNGFNKVLAELYFQFKVFK